MDLWSYIVATFTVATVLRHSFVQALDFSRTCTKTSAPICTSTGSSNSFQWRYNLTTFPTFADDRSPEDVSTSLSALHPLIATSCSKFLNLYLCAVHSPVCTRHGVVPPCRELCERVRNDCRRVSETFGIRWPGGLACESLPKMTKAKGRLRRRKDEGFMDDSADMYVVSRSSSLIWGEALLDNGKVCIPPSEEDVVGPALVRLDREGSIRENWTSSEPGDGDYGVSCPAELRAPPSHTGYSFMGLENCTAPCPNMYLGQQEMSALRGFVCALAAICIIVTLFALLTFAIDRERFRYPERPIVFYAFSYFVVSVVFLIGFILGERAPCNDKVVNVDNEIVQGYAVVVGSHRRICTVLFMILYYFTVNGAIWWLILTITWLLAAGFTWGSEAIEKYWLHYHTVAWILPAVQTMIVIISNKIEGDNITGVCFVGIYDSDGLRFLLLAPMCIYLIIGITLLLTGFLCLNRVRKILEGDAENREKLAKFMLRIGVFSVLFIIPQISLIIIYAVEDMNRNRWEASWYVRSCDKYAVPCPSPSDPMGQLAVGDPRPHLLLFFAKYTMMLVVALPPLFWVASKKTLDSWKNFFNDAGTSKNSSLNTTQTRLLNDSNGPHAKDRDAKLMLEKTSKDGEAVFGDFRDSGLHGSSASVAAAAIASRSAFERQSRWDDLTDTEFTSETSSDMSRAIEYDQRRNRGERVYGRRRQQPIGRASKDKRTEGYVSRPGKNPQKHLRPPNGSAKGDLCRKEVIVSVESDGKQLEPVESSKGPLGSSTPLHTTDKQSASNQPRLLARKQVSPTSESTLSFAKPLSSSAPPKETQQPVEKEVSNDETPKPVPYTETDTIPLPEPIVKALKNAIPKKPRTPPPLPPPRVESANTKGEVERALSV